LLHNKSTTLSTWEGPTSTWGGVLPLLAGLVNFLVFLPPLQLLVFKGNLTASVALGARGGLTSTRPTILQEFGIVLSCGASSPTGHGP
jgi:hypothetical protein